MKRKQGRNYTQEFKQNEQKGNYWDNAVAESFFKSRKVEQIYAHKHQLRSKV